MDLKHEPGRIYSADQTGKIIAEVTFPQVRKGLVTIDHTFVDSSLRGRGIASGLMEEAAKELRANGEKAKPTCSYAKKWFSQHEEFSDVLADGNRESR